MSKSNFLKILSIRVLKLSCLSFKPRARGTHFAVLNHSLAPFNFSMKLVETSYSFRSLGRNMDFYLKTRARLFLFHIAVLKHNEGRKATYR